MGFIRTILALSVLFAHVGNTFGFTLVGGKIAVQSFFIISGFYMAMILSEKYTLKNSYGAFILSRALRIYPLYFLLLTTIILVSTFQILIGQNNPLSDFLTNIASYHITTQIFLVFTNIFVIGQDWGMFLDIDETSKMLFISSEYEGTNPFIYGHLFIPQAWTLSAELLFYAIAPFIVRKHIIFSIILFVISIIIRLYLNTHGFHHEPWTNRFFPSEIAFFLLGVFSYNIYKKINFSKIHKLLPITAFITFIIFTLFYNHIPRIQTDALDITQLVYYFSLVIFLPIIFHLFKNNKRDRIIGELSYPIYLSHLFIASLTLYIFPTTHALFSITVLILSIAASYMLVIGFLIPIDKYRAKIYSRSQSPLKPTIWPRWSYLYLWTKKKAFNLLQIKIS